MSNNSLQQSVKRATADLGIENTKKNMNQDEEKILNGIYRNYEVIDDSIPYYAAELNWLLENKLDKASEWRDHNGRFKSLGTKMTEGEDYLSQISKINYKVEIALSYLRG
jgi:hypothetical protein